MDIIQPNTKIAITSMASIAPTGSSIDEMWNNQINGEPNFTRVDENTHTFSKILQGLLSSKKEKSLIKNGFTDEESTDIVSELINRRGYMPAKIRGEISKGGVSLRDEGLIELIKEEINNTPFSPEFTKKILSLINKGGFDLSVLQAIYMSIVSLNNAKLLGETGIIEENTVINIGYGYAGTRNIEGRGVLSGIIDGNKRAIGPRYLVASLPNMPSPIVANILGTKGAATSNYAACAASLFSIASAMDQILLGRINIALTGGCDSTGDSFFDLLSFGRMGALARGYEDIPNLASRPFSKKIGDKTTKGFVMGDGGGVFTIENLEYAKNRGADLLGEILAIGLSNCNPVRENLPLSSGTIEGQSLAMQQALDRSGITAEQFKNEGGVVFSHGTATDFGDITESKSIHNTFGDGIDVISLKGVLGHGIGGSGAQSLAIALKAFQEKIIPGTLHYSDETRMDGIPDGVNIIGENTKRELSLILINTFGFGGHNASMLVKKN